jgi:hypothetical protein
MEKMMNLLSSGDERIQKSVLNLLQIIFSDNFDGVYDLIIECRIEDSILEEIQNQLPKGKIDVDEILEDPEYQILNLLNRVQQAILYVKQTYTISQTDMIMQM